jgi:hypothetical protein
MKKKTKLFFTSGIISVVLILINYIGTYKTCNDIFECTEILYAAMIVLFPIIPLFIFSLITYKMREEIFEIWWKFARIWIPVSMLAILIAPSYTHNWILPIVKGTVAFASVVLFVIISLALIIWQSNKERKK